MRNTLITMSERRNPFAIRKVPLLARIYSYPYNKWPNSRGRQVLFGAPSLAIFSLLRHLRPFPSTGKFALKTSDKSVEIEFDARNTQYQALYLGAFSKGYEPELTALFDVIVGNSATFFDIGSNWGFFSLFVASKPNFAGKIYAFEPFPSTFRDLRSVVDKSGLGSTIECKHLALSNFEGQTTMSLPDFTHSGLAVIEGKRSKSGGGGIPVSTLDALNLVPSVMKIDAEGAEGEILAGGEKVLATHKPMIVIENWRNFQEVEKTLYPLELLENAGYLLYHPCWLRKGRKQEFFFTAENSAATLDKEVLALVPMSSEDRFLRHDQINVFACHRDKLSELEQRFEIRNAS